MNTLEQLENLNVQRAKFFPDYHFYEENNVLYYANAMSGEAGEFCNMLKKMLRGDEFDRDGITDITPYHICHELADIIMYAELICSMYGYSLSAILREKFNKVSIEKKCELFINKH